jgi:putative transposase
MEEAHLHACLRYVELNPVRARLAERPEDWPWSSARAHLGLAGDGLTNLGALRGRVDDWRALLASGLGDEEREAIRRGERSGRLRWRGRRCASEGEGTVTWDSHR